MNCIESIYDFAYENENLMSVMIEVTSLCNWMCEHCYVSDSFHDKYNLDNLRQLFVKFREKGVNEIVLIGGEIFVKEDIFEIITLARNMFFNVVLESNISLLDKEKIKILSELYISEVSCTVFSLDEKIHDSITGIKGSLNQVLKNLEILKQYNIYTVVKTPLMRKNKYHFRNIHKYCLERGFTYKVKVDLFPKRNGETLESLILPSNDIKDIIDEVDKINTNYFGTCNLDNYPCLNTRISLFLDSQGEVYPCVNYRQPIGNIFFDKLDDIWINPKRIEIANLKYKDLKECISCDNLNKCVPCPGVSHMESGNILSCTKGSLRMANWRK